MDAIKLLSSLLKNNSMGSNILGSLLGGGGGGQSRSGAGGGLGALAGMLGGSVGGSKEGGVGGLLGSILGGGQGGRGGSGLGALAGMLGGSAGAAGLLGKLMGGDKQPEEVSAAVPQEANQEAEILIRAMCNAAKSDGRLDDAEKEKIIANLGEEVTQAEIDFVQAELAAPLDVEGFVRQVPAGAASQVYSFSVMGIKIDEQAEANYLGQLAQGLGLDADTCNQIHDQLGAPRIFA